MKARLPIQMKYFDLILMLWFCLGISNPLPGETGRPSGAQDTADWRAIHMGGNWGANPAGMPLLPADYFEFLRSLNVNWIGISLSLYVEDSMDSTVERNYSDAPFPTFTDENLIAAIRAFRKYGINVYLTLAFEDYNARGDKEIAHPVKRWQLGDPNMHIEQPDIGAGFWPWRIDHPLHGSFIASFWKTYTDEAMHFARIAEAEGVGLFSLGTETERLFRTRSGGVWRNEFLRELRALLDSVRSVYSGMVTYDMGYNALTENGFYGAGSNHLWEDLGLDVVGISAYFRLMQEPPGVVQSVNYCLDNWERIYDDYLIPIKEQNPGLPMVFLEFGYVDDVDSPFQPNNNEFAGKVFRDENKNGLDDGEEQQANIYEAFLQKTEQYPEIVGGAFLWGHDMAGEEEWRSWSAMRTFAVRNKLAEQVVRRHYGGSIRPRMDERRDITIGSDSALYSFAFQDSQSVSIRFIRGSSKGTSLSIMRLSSPDSRIPAGMRFTAPIAYYDISAGTREFVAELEFGYSDSILQASGIDEDELALAFFDSLDSRGFIWHVVPSVLDRNDNSIRIEVNHFSIWALTAETESLISGIANANSLPRLFGLAQNFPNPFNPSTVISFTLPRESEITLAVYNVLGQRIRMLYQGMRGPGAHSVQWDGALDSGIRAAGGIYLYALKTSDGILVRKMLLLR